MPKVTTKDEKPTTVKMVGTFPYAEDYTGIEYFYEGELPVSRGVVIVPTSRPEWIERLLATGYKIVAEEK